MFEKKEDLHGKKIWLLITWWDKNNIHLFMQQYFKFKLYTNIIT